MKLKGIITALVTPFNKGQLDEDGLRQLCQRQLQAGVSGILVLGSTGEAPTLSAEERRRILQITAEEVRGKALLMAGTGTNSTQHSVDLTREAEELGYDIALIITPYYNRPSQEGIYQHFKALQNHTSIPFMVYNHPGRSGCNIQTQTLTQIASLSNCRGVKEASGDLSQIQEVLFRLQGPQFSVMGGDDALGWPALALGGDGIISVASNLLPEAMVALYKAAEEGRLQEAQQLHRQLHPLFEALCLDSNPIPIKTALEILGLPGGPCRLPLCAMGAESRTQLAACLKGEIISSKGIY